MTTKENEKVDILPVLQDEEENMSLIECPVCSSAGEVTVRMEKANAEFEFLGSISCRLQNVSGDDHSFPSRFVARQTRHGDIGILPAPHTVDALGAKVESAGNKTVEEVLEDERQDLIQDIEEASTAKLWELYKSSAVMCRRLVQIPLSERLSKVKKAEVKAAIEKAAEKWGSNNLSHFTLGPLLTIERNLATPLLSAYQREQATRIKEAGNDGAHNKVELEPDFVDGNIREAAIIAATLVHQMEDKKATGTA